MYTTAQHRVRDPSRLCHVNTKLVERKKKVDSDKDYNGDVKP